MKLEILCLLFHSLLSYAYVNYNRALFTNWKKAFGKEYADQDEEESRYEQWKKNLKTVTKHNLEYLQNRQLFRLEMNHFADMNASEVNFFFTGYREDPNPLDDPTKYPQGATYLKLQNIPDEAFPEYVNWKDRGFVARVRNQGDCGSCYAFSAAGALEAQHKRKTGKLVKLSEQNLVDCSDAEGDHGCSGGLMEKSFRYIIRNKGIDTYDSYPYVAKAGTCRYAKKNVGATQVGYVKIPKGNEKLLKEAVATVGPVSIGLFGRSPFLHLYANGIYYEPNCPKKVTHGLLAIGYGTNKDGVDYWIIKNSWGPFWGENGYFRMARNMNNMCGVVNEASYPLV